MEDVQYALQQGSAAEQSFLFVVDSAMRDRQAYPTPSDYYIPFPIPFKNVYAMDLVDATIPRTEYSIEARTNTLVYTPDPTVQTYAAAVLAQSAVSVRLRPGDYNVAQLIEALNAALDVAGLDAGHVPLRVEAVGDPVDITNTLRFVRSEPFAVFMGESTLRGAIGFGNQANAPGGTEAWDGTARYATDASLANDTFASVPSAAASTTPAFAGPVPVELTEYTLDVNDRTLRQSFTAAASGLLAGVTVRGRTSATAALVVRVLDDGGEVADSTTLQAVLGAPGWTGTFLAAHKVLAGTVYTVEFELAPVLTPPALALYKAETFNDDAASAISAKTQVPGAVWEVISALDALCFDLNVTIAGHIVEAPGQCSLVGERYVLVRSPDVEQHLHRDLASAFDRMSPGLGMLKLGGLGYREERFNFLAYTTRPFHPVGKLKGLHIRLETRSGRLYDAHGIDHTLLLSVKMYAPGPSRRIPRDLFPGYQPDPQKAQTRRLEDLTRAVKGGSR